MGFLSIIFVLVVLAQLLITDPPGEVILSVVSWVLWAVWVAEFLLRADFARLQRHLKRTHWWALISLLVPFLRLFCALRALRILGVARFGRVLPTGDCRP